MTFGRAILKAKTVGIRNFRDRLSRLIHTHEMFVVTEHGSPTSVLLPYDDVLEIADVLEELRDKETLKAVAQGRSAIKAGVKGILVSRIFKKELKRKRG